MYTALKASCSCDMSNKPFTVLITPCTCHIHACNSIVIVLSLGCCCHSSSAGWALLMLHLKTMRALKMSPRQTTVILTEKHITWVTALAQQVASKCNGIHMLTCTRLTQTAALGIDFLVPGITLNQLRLELHIRLARLQCTKSCYNCMNV